MNTYKHFLAGIMNVTLNEVHMIVNYAISASPRLLNYVKFLDALKYEDGNYHTYFGGIKKLVDSFVTFWRETMDEALRQGDYLSNASMRVEDLLGAIQHAIDRRCEMIQFFDNEFLPIESAEQQEIYDKIKQKYLADTAGLANLKGVVAKLDKQEKRDEFTKTEFPKAIDIKNNVFLYAHTYISMLLADRLPEIEGSLKEIVQRLRKNMATVQEENDKDLYNLLLRLYEKNQEKTMLRRRGSGSSRESVELNMSIDKIRGQVVERSSQGLYSQLEVEAKYFSDRLQELQQIASTLRKVKAEYQAVQREQAVYRSMSTTELPGSKLEVWNNMCVQYEKRSEQIKDSLIRAAKSLMTFFSIRGPFRAMYADNVGTYHIDEYGHQVYHFEAGLKEYHVDCKRNFKEKLGEERYYFDENGRYLYGDKGQRVYQVQGCSSSYEVGEDTLLKKVTVDCGHSEVPNEKCGMKIKDPTDHVEILPTTEPVDITRTMNPETVRYLWEAMGAILPDALYDVGMLRPKNPIHYLAHRLLAHKYGRTKGELRQKKQEAEAYRANVLKERQEKAAEESRAWKAKQVPRRKPEESDNANEWAAFNTYLATQDLIQSLVYD